MTTDLPGSTPRRGSRPPSPGAYPDYQRRERRAGRAWRLSVWGLLSAALWASGCKNDKKEAQAETVDAGPAQVAEREPNDRPDQATPLAGSSVVTAALSPEPNKPDEDWYVLSSASPRSVDLTVTGVPGTDVVLEVMDADRNRLALVNSEGEGKGERLPNLGLDGKALVRISSAKKGSGGAYTLTAEYAERVSGFEVEPNDRAVDATPLALEAMASGFVGHAGDEDWYRIELPVTPGAEGLPGAGGVPPAPTGEGSADAGGAAAGGTTAGELAGGAGSETGADGGTAAASAAGAEAAKVALRIDISGVEGTKLELSVLTAAEAQLFQAKSKEGEGLSLRNVGIRATDQLLYVVVKSAWTGTGKDAKRGYSAQRYYTLKVAREEGGANAEFEPNDDLGHATPLSQDIFREGFLVPKTDVDYYVLRTDQPMLAKVQLSGVDRLDLVLSMVKPAEQPGGTEQVLARFNDGAVKEPELANNLLCTGECYFKVESNTRKVDGKLVKDFENADTPYRLSVTLTPDLGSEEREPNGTVETATPLTPGKPVRGTIHPKKDSDYYRLDLTGRAVKTAFKATVTGILKVDVGLYLHRVDEDGKLELVQTSDKAKGENPEVIRYTAEPDVYILEVRDAKNREANFQDSYQLTVEEAE